MYLPEGRIYLYKIFIEYPNKVLLFPKQIIFTSSNCIQFRKLFKCMVITVEKEEKYPFATPSIKVVNKSLNNTNIVIQAVGK